MRFFREAVYWIRKGDPRHIGHFYTLWLELQAWVHVAVRWLLLKLRIIPLQPVWLICGLKDRREQFRNGPLQSIPLLDNKDLLFLSIYESEASGDLEDDLNLVLPGQWVYRNEPGTAFSRSVFFNRAAEQAGQGIIFRCDADMELPKNLVWLCNLYGSGRNVWFPRVWMQHESQTGGYFNLSGYGIMALEKKQWLKTGGYNETAFVSWGGEDTELMFRTYLLGMLPIRNKCKGLQHHWHPEPKDKSAFLKNWKEGLISSDQFLAVARRGIRRR